MGAVFASAARAPLTSLASVVEMTGDFALTLAVMLAVAIASMTSRALSYGTIYITKLLRRGTDIDRATPGGPWPTSRSPTPCAPSACRSRFPPPTAAARHRTGPHCPGRSSTRPTRRPCSPPSPSPRRCGSWRYRLAEITITAGSPAAGRKLADVTWPPGSTPVTVLRGHQLRPPHPELTLAPGDRVSLLTAAPGGSPERHPGSEHDAQPADRETNHRE